ncbi:MAG: hypothetical protein IT215_01555 [Chitinophagaceae bacterium]|nr:hypothetical protein [Chitinophagaceae bacterium]
MRKICFLIISYFFFSISTFGQNNFALINNQHLHNLGSSQLPSLLGDDIKTGEVFLFPFYVGFGNNMVSSFDLSELNRQEKLSNEYIDKVIYKIPKKGNIWVGADVPILNVFFRVNKKNKEPFLNFGLGMREKLDLNFTLNKNLFSLLYKGNKQFEDQTVNLAPALNFLFYNEYFIAASSQFQLNLKDSAKASIVIKTAIRLRYLQGMTSIYMPNSNINLYTAPDGRFIDLSSDLAVNMSSAIDTPDIQGFLDNVNLNSMKSSGKGLGMDLGVGIEYFKNLQLHVALADIGNIHFNRNQINYSSNETYRYDGIELNENGDPINMANIDSLLQPTKTYNSYKQPLPTRFILSGLYGIHKKTKKKIDYYEHNISLTYVQGFRNYLSSTISPTINMGYAYNYANMVNAGINLTVGGVNQFQGGAQLGLRLGAVKLGLASNNLLPLISSKTGKGTDAFLYLGFYF